MADNASGNGGANWATRILRAGKNRGPGKLLSRFRPRQESLRETIEDAIEEHLAHTPDFTPLERLMLENIMSVGRLRVDDVMVPRADIVAVELGISLSDLVKVFNEASHSRLPIYRETLDEPTGMVHIKDLMRRWFDADAQSRAGFSAGAIRRDVLFVPPSMRVVDLLLKMRVTRIHMALVIDEYGGTDGLVTIEDLVEEVVGEIRDEHDAEGPRLAPRADGGYDADARVEVSELEKLTGLALVPDDLIEYADTLGGLVSALLGRVPQRGELIAHPAGLEFEVVEADARSVKRLRVRRRAASAMKAAV